jgi:desulfoferrodoxin (superoxide reductase-like protein)
MSDFKVIPGETEKKHIPSFMLARKYNLIPAADRVDVRVKIGEILHPAALPEHHIKQKRLFILMTNLLKIACLNLTLILPWLFI